MTFMNPAFSVIRRNDEGLFDYQQEMKSDLYEAWTKHLSVMCQMPTGTGKTRLLVSVTRDFVHTWKHPVWIIAHRIELVEQISRTLDLFGLSHGRILSGQVMNREKVQVASIQTLANRLQKENGMPDDLPAPGLIVIDEAHHALADSYTLLWKHFPDAYKLGLTATPCRLSRRGFTAFFDTLLTSKTISQFIEEGRLALFDYVSIRPDSSAQHLVDGLCKRGADGDYSVREMGTVLDTPESVCRLYDSYKRFAEGKKGIIYAIDRAHSRHICDYYRKQGVRIEAIDSRTPAAERADCVARYAGGELDVIVNVDIFSEGFDCPAVEFIQLARPTLSLSKYLQQVGRGLRVHPGKVRTIILDQVGLFRQFGLPTDDRDWQELFAGKQAGKGKIAEEREQLLERQEKRSEKLPAVGAMVVIQGYEDFLRQVANRKAEVEPFEENGKYGLRKGDITILLPFYFHIAPFVGKYAVVADAPGRLGILNKNGHLLLLPNYSRIDLYADDFAYVEESPVLRYYLDLKSMRRFDTLPTVFRLDFLEFVCVKGNYYLRIKEKETTRLPVFRQEDMILDGDVFYHRKILIHRVEPKKVYLFLQELNGNQYFKYGKDILYIYRQGMPPSCVGKVKYTCDASSGKLDISSNL